MNQDSDRLDERDARSADELARAHAALAAAQDRSYWLDRWHVDLNAVMRRRGASELRAAVRALRAVYRAVYNTSDRLRRGARELPERAAGVTRVVGEERAQAQAVAGATSVDAAAARLRASPVSDRLGDRIDPDDPHALVAVQRADILVQALVSSGGEPQAGQDWLGLGASADSVLTVIADAFPGLGSHVEANGPVDVAFLISDWSSSASPLERVDQLRDVVKPEGRLLLTLAPRSESPPLTAEDVLAHCTPDWRIALYLPGGMEAGRDLYVLERA